MLKRCQLPGGVRRGYVLFAVLIVITVLTLVAYQYAEAMTAQHGAAVRSQNAEQAKANAVSGLHWACACLADPNNAGLDFSDNPGLFSNQSVGGNAGKFTLFNVANSGDGSNTFTVKYGLADESAKININALIALDPTGNVLNTALLTLPNMTANIADAITDWVDSDSTARPSGAEDDTYMALSTPYHIKNGPISSLEELLMVQEMTPELLYGADRNRNGVQDTAETPGGGTFDRGWSEFLTCYGRELNTDSAGVQRTNINGTDLAATAAALTAALGQEVSDYIMYFRFSSNGTATAPLTKTQVSAPVGSLSDLVKTPITNNAPIRRQLSSVMSVAGTQIPLPRVNDSPPDAPTRVVASPFNDSAVLAKVARVLLDKFTTRDDFELTPRINVNTAPQEVLAALPGLSSADVSTLIGSRTLTAGDDTAAWAISAASLSPAKFRLLERYVGGRSGVYRVHSVGYGEKAGGPVARVEAVIEFVNVPDANGNLVGRPRIVQYHELNDLGRGFDTLPR